MAKLGSIRYRSRYAPYLFTAPFVVVFLAFGLYPLMKSMVLAFFITSGPKSSVFVGWENFRFLLTDPMFGKAVWNTAFFAACSVFLQLPLSLGLALLLNSKRLVGRNFFRLSFFSPRLLGMVFVALLFGQIFAPRYGILNIVLNALFGVSIETAWLKNPNLVMPAVILTSLWLYVGFNMIYFLPALQAVDQQLYEAAKVDGANRWKQFLHVTLPGIKPVAVFVVVLSTIGSFQLFELPYLMLENTSGPDNSGLTAVMYLYQNGFESGDLGYASTIGWSLAIAVLLLSLVQIRLSGTWKREA